MDRNIAVILDACVLYPARLKDLFMELSGLAHQNRIFRAKWTEQIHDEWIRNLLKDKPDLKPEALARTRSLMNLAVPDSVVTGYEHRIESLMLPDPDDRHVLAAAIECGAGIIVTANLSDFPEKELKHCSVIAKRPDDFLCEFLADNEELGEKLLEKAVRDMKARLLKPPYSWSELFACLEANSIPGTVEKLRALIPASEVIHDESMSERKDVPDKII